MAAKIDKYDLPGIAKSHPEIAQYIFQTPELATQIDECSLIDIAKTFELQIDFANHKMLVK